METSITLGKVASRLTMLEITCGKCERRGRLRISRLIEEHGRDQALPELRGIIAADCPRQNAISIYYQCGIRFPQLVRLFAR